MYVTINYNMYTICVRNTARSKTIPLMCTHVYSYVFSTVHPPRASLTPIPIAIGGVSLKKSKLKYKVFHLVHVCIALCHAHIIYIHSTFPWMSRVCIYLKVHDHHLSNGTCREILDVS